MSYDSWLNYLSSAEKNSMISLRTRKVFYKFPDGKQMVEEYSLDTGVVQKRAWRKQRQLMGEPEWEIELGETPKQIGTAGGDHDIKTNNSEESFTLCEANTEPIISKRVTKKNIEWRIRNLPYPIDVYQVTADADRRAIIVRTTNKKFYKVIEVPELNRCNLLPAQSELTVHHQYNTLILTYRKPPLLSEMEAKTLILLKDVQTESDVDDFLQGILGNK